MSLSSLENRVERLEQETRLLRRRVAQLEEKSGIAEIPRRADPVTPALSQTAPAGQSHLPPPLPGFRPPPAQATDEAPLFAAVRPLSGSGDRKTVVHPPDATNQSDEPRIPAWQASPEPAGPQGPSFSDRLRAWGMLPPSEGDREVALGAWWATRIGAVLGVLAAVFLAVYVSLDTAPWVRWLQLLAVAAGVTFAGWRLEQRIENFGRVVLGLGLSLVFFAAVAGYAIPAVRVFETAAAGAAAQGAAILLMLGFALTRDSERLSALAVIFGALAALWGRTLEIPELGWTALAALLLLSLALRSLNAWGLPLLIALPAAGVGLWLDAAKLGGVNVALPIAGVVWLMTWAQEVHLARQAKGDRTIARILLSLNGGIAVLIGWRIFTQLGNPERLDAFFLGAGILFLAAAAVHRFAVPGRWGFSFHFIKGATLLLLAAVMYFDGPARWFSVLAQAWLWLLAARRENIRLLEYSAALVWLVSVAVAAHTLLRDGFQPDLRIWSGLWLAAAALWAHVWIRTERFAKDREVRAAPIAWRPGVAGIPLVFASLVWWFTQWNDPVRAAVALVAAGLFAGSAALLRSRFIGALAGLWWLLGALALFIFAQERPGLNAWVGAGLASIPLTAAAWSVRHRNDGPATMILAAGASGLVAARAGILWLPAACLPLLLGVLALGALAVARRSGPDARWSGPLGFMLPLMGAVVLLSFGFASQRADYPWLWIAGGGLLLAIPTLWLRFPCERDAWPRHSETWSPDAFMLGASAVLVLITSRLVAGGILATELVWTCIAVAVVLGLGAARLRVPHAAVMALLALAVGLFLQVILRFDAGDSPMLQILALSLGALTLGAGAFREFWSRDALAEHHKLLLCFTAAIGTALLADAAWMLPGGANRHVTALWGLTGVLVFAGGLAGNWRPWRFAGLALLGLSIARLFVVDMNSTLTRIFAFAALAVVLLIVGWLYQRFGERLSKRE